MYYICYLISEQETREAMGEQKLIDSIHDLARRYDLKADVSPMTSYFTLTDSTPGGMQQNLVQQPMMMMGTPQAMPTPGQEMYQQQPVYAPYGKEMYQQQLAYAPPPIGGLPMMPPGYAKAPEGYAHTPQNGNYGAPPIEAYDPMNVNL